MASGHQTFKICGVDIDCLKVRKKKNYVSVMKPMGGIRPLSPEIFLERCYFFKAYLLCSAAQNWSIPGQPFYECPPPVIMPQMSIQCNLNEGK